MKSKNKTCERCGEITNQGLTFCDKCDEILEISLWHESEMHPGNIEECQECLEMFLKNDKLDLLSHEKNIPQKEKVFKNCDKWEVIEDICPICK